MLQNVGIGGIVFSGDVVFAKIVKFQYIKKLYLKREDQGLFPQKVFFNILKHYLQHGL